MEIGRQARAALGEVEPVAGVVIAVDAAGEPALEATSGGRLAGLGQERRVGGGAVAEAERSEIGDGARIEVVPAETSGRRQDGTAWQPLPRTPEG